MNKNKIAMELLKIAESINAAAFSMPQTAADWKLYDEDEDGSENAARELTSALTKLLKKIEKDAKSTASVEAMKKKIVDAFDSILAPVMNSNSKFGAVDSVVEKLAINLIETYYVERVLEFKGPKKYVVPNW